MDKRRREEELFTPAELSWLCLLKLFYSSHKDLSHALRFVVSETPRLKDLLLDISVLYLQRTKQKRKRGYKLDIGEEELLAEASSHQIQKHYYPGSEGNLNQDAWFIFRGKKKSF